MDRRGNDNWIGPGSIIGTCCEYQGREQLVSREHGSIGLIKVGYQNAIRAIVTIRVSPQANLAFKEKMILGQLATRITHITISLSTLSSCGTLWEN